MIDVGIVADASAFCGCPQVHQSLGARLTARWIELVASLACGRPMQQACSLQLSGTDCVFAR